MSKGNKGKDYGKDISSSSKPKSTRNPVGNPVGNSEGNPQDVSETDFGLFRSLPTKKKKSTDIS